MKILTVMIIAVVLCSCASAPEKEFVKVPSSKPYKFITWSVNDTEKTKQQIRAHNRAHQAVINTENKAKN